MKRYVSLFLIASNLTLVAVIGVLSRPEIATTRALPHKPAAEASVVPSLAAGVGAIITSVLPDGPADQAGLQEGDIVIAFDGQQIDFDHDLGKIISTYQPGNTVIFDVERPGEGTRHITVRLGQHPGEEGKAYLGIVYQPAHYAERSKEAGNSASKVIKLASREITPEELTTLAPFEILWPQDLPDGYQLLHIMEMSESLTESSHSGIFYLEYIKTNDQDKPLSDQSRLVVWERLKTTQTLPNLDGKQPVDTLRLADGTQIPIYTSEGGRAKRAFLERGQVNIELSFWGVPLEDVARIASSLAPN
jgi:hypothetical protein